MLKGIMAVSWPVHVTIILCLFALRADALGLRHKSDWEDDFDDDLTDLEAQRVRRLQARTSINATSFVDVSVGAPGTEDAWTATDSRLMAMTFDRQHGWICRRGDAVPKSPESYHSHQDRCCAYPESCSDERKWMIPPGGGRLESKRAITAIYVPIYKNGNSLMRRFMRANVGLYMESSKQVSDMFLLNPVLQRDRVASVTFVRHPIYRYISGYNTVIGRFAAKSQRERCASNEWNGMFAKSEPERFQAITEYFVANGYATVAKAKGDCPSSFYTPAIVHLLSQLWFLEAWPNKLQFIGRTEYMKEGVGAFLNKTVVDVSRRHELLKKWSSMDVSGSPPIRSIAVDDALREVVHMQMLHEYFVQDFKAFGYRPLEGFNLPTVM